eukprot:scaffold79572_cov67-Attheya_sp.AAC.1
MNGMMDRLVPTDARMITGATNAAATCHSKSMLTALCHRGTSTAPPSNDWHEWENEGTYQPNARNKIDMVVVPGKNLDRNTPTSQTHGPSRAAGLIENAYKIRDKLHAQDPIEQPLEEDTIPYITLKSPNG